MGRMAVETVLEFEKPLRAMEEQVQQLRAQSEASGVDFSSEIASLEEKVQKMRRDIYGHLDVWERVQLSRHPERPYSLDYIHRIFDDFSEIHGDRLFSEDPSTVCGVAWLEGRPIMVIGQQKGRTLKENIKYNFGCPYPEGYRKALRVMQLADKFQMPVVTFIDTPGAYPGIGSEERHIGEAIAINLRDMSALNVPTVGIVIGEGGSGGALGIGVVDRLLILENAYYSVISPEGCAAILWKDRAKAPDAARALKLDPQQLVKYGIADEVLSEPLGGAHGDIEEMSKTIKSAILRNLKELEGADLRALRYKKYRAIGVFSEYADPENSTDSQEISVKGEA